MPDRYGIQLDLDENLTEALTAAADATLAARNEVESFSQEAEKSFSGASDVVSSAEKAIRKAGDTAAASLGETISSAEKAATALAEAGTTGEEAFDATGDAVDSFNTALEIANRGIALYESTITSAIDEALRFRREGDASVATFERLARESELVKARIGDALIPVLLGLRDAFVQSQGAMSALIADNQRLIGSGLLDWIQSIGRGLINGIAVPIELVAKAWIGWQLIIQQVKVFALEFVNSFRGEIAELLSSVAELAKFAGFDSVARKIAAIQTQLSTGIITSDALDAAKEGLDDTVQRLSDVENSLDSLKSTALNVFDAGIAKAQERVAEAVVGTNLTLDEQRQRLERINEFVDRVIAKQQAARERVASIRERDIGLADTAQQAGVNAVEQASVAAMSAIGDVGAIVQGFATGAATGLIALGEAILGRSEALQKILGTVGDAFGDMVEALDPLFEAIAPVTDSLRSVAGVLIDAFRPVIDALAAVLRPLAGTFKVLAEIFVSLSPMMIQLRIVLAVWAKALEGLAWVIRKGAEMMIDIVESVSDTWNGLIRGVSDILRKLGDVEVFGKRPLGFISDWANQLERDATVTADVLERWRRDIAGNTSDIGESADLMRLAARDSADAMGEVASSLTNVPTGVKVALARFNAMAPEDRQSSSPWDGRRGSSASAVADAITAVLGSGFGAPTNNYYVDTVSVSGTVDIVELVESIGTEAERTATQSQGSLAANVVAPRGSAQSAVVEAAARSPLLTGAMAPVMTAAQPRAQRMAGRTGSAINDLF